MELFRRFLVGEEENREYRLHVEEFGGADVYSN